MTTITLHIFLMGLVALVPKANNGGPQTLTVLLQDERAAPCMRHVPVLIYDIDARVCPNYYPKCGYAYKVGDGDEIARQIGRTGHASPGLLLKGEEITIQKTYGQYASGEKPRKPHWWEHWIGGVPRSPAIGSNVAWLPRMRDIIPGSSEVRRDLMGLNPKGLAGRLVLGNGALSTFSLADVGGQIRSMTFRPLGSKRKIRGVKQAVTDVAVVTVNVNAPTVTIRLQEFGSYASRTLILKPNANGEVDILVGNLSPLQSKFNRKSPAEHFSLYTKLSAAPKKAFEMPIPHLGWSMISEARQNIEREPLPIVIQSINQYVAPGVRPVPSQDAKASGGEGGTNRPICTVAVMDAPLTQAGAGVLPVKPLKEINLKEAYEIALTFLAVEEITGVESCDDSSGQVLRFNVKADAKTDDILSGFLEALGVDFKGLKDLNQLPLPFQVKFSKVRYRVERAASASAVEQPTDKWRPLRPGASIGIESNGPGTLGLFVKANKVNYFISAAHVVESIGANVCQPEQDVIQACQAIGSVADLHLEEVDAALVKLGNIKIDPAQLTSHVVVGAVGRAACGDIVEKSSRSTLVREGKINGFGEYEVELDDGTSITIKGFSIVPVKPNNPDDEEISAPGDSGAVWYLPQDNGKGVGVGLHVAGEVETEPEKEQAIASDLCLVLKTLKVLKDNGLTVICP